MSIGIQIENIECSGNGDVYVEGELLPSGNYVAGGDTVDFMGVNSAVTFGANFTGTASVIPSTVLKQFDAWSEGGLLTYQYAAVRGAGGLGAAKLKVGAASTFGTELSPGAYPGAVTGDTIAFFAVFKKLQ